MYISIGETWNAFRENLSLIPAQHSSVHRNIYGGLEALDKSHNRLTLTIRELLKT